MSRPRWRVVTCRPDAFPNCSRTEPHVIIYDRGYPVEYLAGSIREAWAWIADHTNGSGT